ncbi:MAG TPA: sensor histidine kinase, partial [Anaeromyxobacteraceae bacterium]|nr:sensor histidine kinase [Anaeromyxobacteraceae bacterium]
MLSDFLEEHRVAIVDRARARVAARRVPLASPGELSSGVPLFLSQLTELLRGEQGHVAEAPVRTTDDRAHDTLGGDADERGAEMLREGLTIAQVVEGYGDVCQAITEHAIEQRVHLGSEEYRTLNLCLDVATSRAVTAFSAARDRSTVRESTEKLG